tara:strand:+ start:266 stop:475 length:210 start_codon:yes stop_codon:yes gene_type:complete
MRRFNRHRQNLCVIQWNGADYVMSYTTRVAKIDYSNKTLNQLGWWSVTTQRHINYAADQLGLTLNRNGH